MFSALCGRKGLEGVAAEKKGVNRIINEHPRDRERSFNEHVRSDFNSRCRGVDWYDTYRVRYSSAISPRNRVWNEIQTPGTSANPHRSDSINAPHFLSCVISLVVKRNASCESRISLCDARIGIPRIGRDWKINHPLYIQTLRNKWSLTNFGKFRHFG